MTQFDFIKMSATEFNQIRPRLNPKVADLMVIFRSLGIAEWYIDKVVSTEGKVYTYNHIRNMVGFKLDRNPVFTTFRNDK